MIAVLTVGGDAAASHQTAAELWGLTDRCAGRIDVVVERWDRVHRSFAVHESRDLEKADIERTEGIPVTSPPRTVVDLGATAPWLVESALETGIRRGLMTLTDVESFVARVGRRGRQGVGVIRPFIEARRRWDGNTESQLEDLFLRVVTGAGIPEPEANLWLTTAKDSFAEPTSHTGDTGCSSSLTARRTTWIASPSGAIERSRTAPSCSDGDSSATRGGISRSNQGPSSTSSEKPSPPPPFRRSSRPCGGCHVRRNGLSASPRSPSPGGRRRGSPERPGAQAIRGGPQPSPPPGSAPPPRRGPGRHDRR